MMESLIRELEGIYGKLCDDESRDIFKNRLLYNFTGELRYIRNIVRYVPEFGEGGMYDDSAFERFLNKIILKAQGKKIIIYGAGWNGQRIFERLTKKEVLCFCDKKAQAGTYTYCGIPVLTVDKALEAAKDAVFVISAAAHTLEIQSYLAGYGVKEENLVLMEDKNMFIGCSLRQYFDADIVRPVGDEVFVDCGCYDCETIAAFKKWCADTDKFTYAFEADASNYELCKAIIKQKSMNNVRLFNKAVWSSEQSLSFYTLENTPSANRIAQEGTETVQGVRLDDVLDIQPTFIKMDIEGAELEALKGAKETIKRCRPRLAICIYHKPEDILTIPQFVSSLDDTYRFYIRHYGNWLMDTILYAV